jgi:hypothetical protein
MCWQARHVQTINEKKQAMNANLTKTQASLFQLFFSDEMMIDFGFMQAFESYYDQKHDVTVRAPTAMGR